MRQKTDNEELMVGYLLGELDEEEQLRLEERFFTDDDFYRQLLAMEDELRYDYAAGALSPSQRARFERRFLNSPQARRKAGLARAVLEKAAEGGTALASAPQPTAEERRSFWTSLVALFSLSNPAVRYSLAAATVIFVAGASWLFYRTLHLRSQLEQLEAARAVDERQRAQQTAEEGVRRQQLVKQLDIERRRRAQLERELESLQAQAARDRDRKASSSSAFLSFVLSPGLVRGSDGPKRLLISSGASSLRLQLELKRPDDYRGYRATIATLDGAELWSQDLPRSRASASSRSVMLSLPANLVPPGDYVLALKGRLQPGEMEEIDEYYFTVVRR